MLSSPALTCKVRVMLAGPPQHVSGNAVPDSCGESAGLVASTRNLLTILMFVSGIATSGTPSPLASQLMVTEVGPNKQPTMSSLTSQSALMIPMVDCDCTGG